MFVLSLVFQVLIEKRLLLTLWKSKWNLQDQNLDARGYLSLSCWDLETKEKLQFAPGLIELEFFWLTESW